MCGSKEDIKILALKGVFDSGKTSSIKYLILKFVSMSRTKVLCFSPFRDKTKNINDLKIQILNHIDESIRDGLYADRNISLLVVSIWGMTIGMTTYGDQKIDIYRAYKLTKEVTQDNLDYFVCCRHGNNSIKQEYKDKVNSFEELVPIVK